MNNGDFPVRYVNVYQRVTNMNQWQPRIDDQDQDLWHHGDAISRG